MAKIADVKDGENTLIVVGQEIKNLTHKTIKCYDAIKSDVKVSLVIFRITDTNSHSISGQVN
mgnify:CR=1 FL=1